MPRVCSVNECSREAKSARLGICDPHYKRKWRTGDVQAHVPLKPQRQAIPNPVDVDGQRECWACKRVLPLTDYHNDAKAPGGKRKSCKQCRTAQETERYREDPEGHAARIREFRKNNLDHVRKREANYYEENKEKRIEAAITQSHERRARIKSLRCDKGITVPQLRKRHGDNCIYCRVPLDFERRRPKGERPGNMATLEHRMPISKGGTHTWDNCALACWRCNITKNAKTEAEYLDQLARR